MTDNITLPRAVVEMVRDSLDYARRFNGASVSSEIAALDAALGAEMSATGDDCRQPATEPDTTREPATDEQVAAAYKANYDNGWFPLIFFDAWREAERHHGIRKEDGK